MNACPDCGGEILQGQCEICGLTPLAAELALRRRLLNGTAIFLLGAVAFLPAAHLYPPLELDQMLIFLGVVSFVGLSGVTWLDIRARAHRPHPVLKRILYGLLPVPWLLASLLWVNGRFDSSEPIRLTTKVIGRFSMPGALRNSRLIVASWREGRRLERIAISSDEFARFREGDIAEVYVQKGLAGIPWIYAVYRK